MFNFGAGRARVSAGGQTFELGVVQSSTLELKVDLKELRGPYRYPIAVADGKGTASGKISFMQMWPSTIAALINNGSPPVNTATPTAIIGESGVIAAGVYSTASAFIKGSEVVSVTVAGSPCFYQPSPPNGTGTPVAAGGGGIGLASGLYQYGTGNQLKFAITGGVGSTGDNGNTVNVSYLSAGSNINNYAVTLQQIGMNTALTFQAVLIGVGKNIYTNAAQQFVVQLNACLAPSLKFDMKLDDFTGLELDFSAFIDATGTLGSFYFISP